MTSSGLTVCLPSQIGRICHISKLLCVVSALCQWRVMVLRVHFPQKHCVGVRDRGLASPICRLPTTLSNTTGSSISFLRGLLSLPYHGQFQSNLTFRGWDVLKYALGQSNTTQSDSQTLTPSILTGSSTTRANYARIMKRAHLASAAGVRMPSSRAHIDLFTHFYSVCPGIPFAERTVWIEIAMLLWTFNIRKAKEPSAETGTSLHLR